MKTNKNLITLTYKIYPETKGYSVKCLDWHCVYTQGDTIKDCIKHAIEATKLMLPDLKNGTLHKSDYPEIKPHKKSKNTFNLTFDIEKNKKTKQRNIAPLLEKERNLNSFERGLIQAKEIIDGKRIGKTLDELLHQESQKKISVTIKNKQLDALEDLLFSELSFVEREEATKQAKKLWHKLVKGFDR